MDNPLELPVPDDSIEQIHLLARDLAYGVAKRFWGATISVVSSSGGENWFNFAQGADSAFDEYVAKKWNNTPPASDLVLSFGYFQMVKQPNKDQINFLLTQKAFALLEKPITSPKIFISYRRDESSALALLVEARLKLVDGGIGVFIDKELEPGDKWYGKLEREVRQRPYFVCLLGPESLGSKFVRDEIRWALEEAEKRGAVIIPICHNGYTIGVELSAKLASDADEIRDLVENLSIHNAIVVHPEGAEQYELAMIKLLNRLGYSNI